MQHTQQRKQVKVTASKVIKAEESPVELPITAHVFEEVHVELA